MASTSKSSNGPLLPLLYVLLAVDGILTVLLAAGIAWFAMRPAESVEEEAPTRAVVEMEHQSPYGPRTMISTYSIRAEERGWNMDDYAANPSTGQDDVSGQAEESATVPEEEPDQEVPEVAGNNEISGSGPVIRPEEPQTQNPAEVTEPAVTPKPETQTRPQASPTLQNPPTQTNNAPVQSAELNQKNNQTNGNDKNAQGFSAGQVLITTASNNNNDPVYHTMDCRTASKILPEDRAWIESEDAAKAEGRRLCGWCSKGG